MPFHTCATLDVGKVRVTWMLSERNQSLRRNFYGSAWDLGTPKSKVDDSNSVGGGKVHLETTNKEGEIEFLSHTTTRMPTGHANNQK